MSIKNFSLNGIWDFVLDTNNNGVEQNYHKQENQPYLDDKIKVNLPHCWNTEPQGDFKDYSGTAWYFRTFRIPVHFIGNRIFLHFERIARSAMIFIDGEEIGKFKGSFIPFEIDITKFDDLKEHFLAVRIDASENARRFPSVPDVEEYFGIFGDVFIRVEEKIALMDHFLETKLHFNSNGSVEYAELSFTLYFKNTGNEDYSGTITLELLQDYVSIINSEREIKILKNNSRLMKIVMIFEKPELWSPEEPNLYNLSIRVSNELGTVIREERKIGIREIGLKEDNIILNGKILEIRAKEFNIEIPESGYVIPEINIFKRLQELKNQKINVIYPNQGTFSPFIINLASYFGFMVFAILPIVDLSLTEKSTYFKLYIDSINLEPSLAIYTCNNKIATNAEINKILLSMEKLFLEIDPSHLFVNSHNLRIE
ncbi:MAG: sugar-binding domain-containing protein, partial [Promethearchaeota archaeon]